MKPEEGMAPEDASGYNLENKLSITFKSTTLAMSTLSKIATFPCCSTSFAHMKL